MSEPIPPFDELPELMLSLRRFGSGRRLPNETPALEDEQARFFAPLLDARRTAAKAVTRAQAIAAFDPRRLTAQIDATVRAFAAQRCGANAPARRAFEAELFEVVEPLRDALQSLRTLAEKPISDASTEQWALWVAQLRVVFRIADTSWPALADALAPAPRAPAASRWRRRSGGEEHR
jgi:hypothetical protein